MDSLLFFSACWHIVTHGHGHTLMSSKGLHRQIVPDLFLSASWVWLTSKEMIRGRRWREWEDEWEEREDQRESCRSLSLWLINLHTWQVEHSELSADFYYGQADRTRVVLCFQCWHLLWGICIYFVNMIGFFLNKNDCVYPSIHFLYRLMCPGLPWIEA